MSRQGFFIHFSILFLLLFIHGPSKAEPLQCKKVVISGEPGWPPYSYMKEGHLTGASVDLARRLFHELNIPVEVRAISDQRELEHQLRRGHVDLLVATYDLPKYEKIARLVLPHYFADSLGIIVPSGEYFQFSDWHDLMGRIGVTPSNNQLGREFTRFAEKNLNITSIGNLRYDFRKLNRGEYEYIVGSAQLLAAGINWYGNDSVEFLPMLVGAEDVYMGFSHASPCKGYTAYFRTRLAELSENQTIHTLMNAHINSEI